MYRLLNLRRIQAEMTLTETALSTRQAYWNARIENSLWWRKTAYIMATLVVGLACVVAHLLMG